MTRKSIITILSTALIAISLFSSNVNASNKTTVTFKAAIFVPPCSYNVIGTQMDLACFNNENNKMKTTSIDFKNHEKSNEWKKFENNNGIYQLKWTNKEKGFAMFSVQYA